MLMNVYGESALTDKSSKEWFRRLKSGDFSDEDEKPTQKKSIRN